MNRRPTRHTKPLTLATPRALKPRKGHIWERDALDFYIEERWVNERLFDMETFHTGKIYDPACGVGRVLEAAQAAGYSVLGSDIVDRDCRFQDAKADFLHGVVTTKIPIDIVSNPPFTIADEFLQKALKVTTHKVALLMPATWHLGDWRARMLRRTPLRRVWCLSPRPSRPPGLAILDGLVPGGGRSDFAWYIWEHGYDGHPELRSLWRDRNRT